MQQLAMLSEHHLGMEWWGKDMNTSFPNLFSVDYKFPENEAILRKLITFDKVTWRKTLVSTFLNV